MYKTIQNAIQRENNEGTKEIINYNKLISLTLFHWNPKGEKRENGIEARFEVI